MFPSDSVRAERLVDGAVVSTLNSDVVVYVVALPTLSSMYHWYL